MKHDYLFNNNIMNHPVSYASTSPLPQRTQQNVLNATALNCKMLLRVQPIMVSVSVIWCPGMCTKQRKQNVFPLFVFASVSQLMSAKVNCKTYT